MHRFIRLPIIVLCLALILSSVFAVKEATTAKSRTKTRPEQAAPKVVIPPEDVLAEFEGGLITKKDLEERISKLPPQAQGRYKTVEGQTQILDMMVVEEVFFRKAQDLNLLEAPSVLERINAAKKHLLVQEFYKRNIRDKTVLSEAEKQDYYHENLAEFFVPPNISIRYIQPADEASATKALNELKKGVPFPEVSTKYSINTFAKNLGGKIANIRLTGNIPGVGNDSELEDIIRNSPVDTLNYIGPVKTTTGWSIIQVIDRIEGRQRPYLECEAEVHQRLKPIKEAELLNTLMDSLKKKYHVVIDTVSIAGINLREVDKSRANAAMTVVTASDTSLVLTVGNLLDRFNRMPPQEQMMYIKGGGGMQLVNQELNRSLMYLEASNDKSYLEFLDANEDFKQTSRFHVLQEAYKKLVVDQIVITDEDMRNYYDKHVNAFTTPSARKIQVIWCKDERIARRVQRRFAAAVRRNNQKRIAELIEKYSISPEQEILDNIYNNGVVVGIGNDQKLSDLIWQTPVGKVSPVARSIQNDILVFRVMEERPPIVKSFTEVEPRLRGQLRRERERAKMDTVKVQLFTQYALKKYPEKLVIKLSAEELFNMADDAARQRKYKDAIIYYDQIIQFYPNGVDDYKAFFMKAFLTAEEIGNKELGLQLFKEFLRKFPTGELNESAQFMIDELEGRTLGIDGFGSDGDNDR